MERKRAGSQGPGDAGQSRQNGFVEKNNSCFNPENLTELSSSSEAKAGTAPGGPGLPPRSACPGLPMPLPPPPPCALCGPGHVHAPDSGPRSAVSPSFCMCLFNHDLPATWVPLRPGRRPASQITTPLSCVPLPGNHSPISRAKALNSAPLRAPSSPHPPNTAFLDSLQDLTVARVNVTLLQVLRGQPDRLLGPRAPQSLCGSGQMLSISLAPTPSIPRGARIPPRPGGTHGARRDGLV